MSGIRAKVKRDVGAAVTPWGATAARIALCALFIVAACRTAPIQDVVDAPLPGVCPEATPGDVDEAIWRAGRKEGWEIEQLRPGALRGTRRFNRHRAVVSISQEAGRLCIRYEDSENLLAADGRIHRNYNHLVQELLARIQQEPVRLGPDAVCPWAAETLRAPP